MIRVCLQQVRPEARKTAAELCARYETREAERAELLFAALFPSDNVYFLPESVAPILREVAA